MNRSELLKEIGYKLKKIRNTLGYPGPYMASKVGVARSSYLKNEKGETCPDIISMRNLGINFGVSLDWLIGDKGPMYYQEKEKEPVKTGKIQSPLPEDIQELLDHMGRIPLLRYKILAAFHEFKAQYKDMVVPPPGI